MFKLFSTLVLLLPFKLYFRCKVKGLENVPKKGSCLILSNHVSHIDPPFVGIAVYFRKKTKFMARDTLFSNIFLRFFLEHVGAIPLNRGTGYRGGFEKALEALKKEEIALVAFPEGTRSQDGKLQPGKPGIGLFALQANLPIVPCFITGAYEAMPKNSKFPKPKQITFTFGKPFSILPVCDREPDKEDYKRVAKEIMKNIAELGGVEPPATEGKI
ncbi:MAG: lysophospholipid acyltransferase family protein [Candidatus Firestonebacteria bacterium]|nr:lysophospholipid acyltransferase family protein [Candidatus Firestonebacteria bacterium]